MRYVIIGTTECKFRGLDHLYVEYASVPGFYETQDDEGNDKKVPIRTFEDLENEIAENGTYEDYRIIEVPEPDDNRYMTCEGGCNQILPEEELDEDNVCESCREEEG